MKIKIMSIIAFVLLLSTPIISSTQIHNNSNFEDDNNEPKWGWFGLSVEVKEKYGSDEDPQYRPLSNVTVYFYSFMKKTMPLIYYINFIPTHIKKIIFQILAIKILKTNIHGKTLIGDYGWHPLLLVYVEKDGYNVVNDLFQYEYPEDPPSTLYFLMDENLIKN